MLSIVLARLVGKLGLKTTPHLSLTNWNAWLSENGELVIDKQFLLIFSIGKYVDEVLYDVVLMKADHIFLDILTIW